MTVPAQTFSLESLAFFGGRALFEPALHVGKPQIPDAAGLLVDIAEVFASGILTNQGPRVEAFEAAICDYLGVAHCVTTCNGTLALLLLLKALNLKGEVIVPAFTFPATVQVLDWLGLEPVFCDIAPVSHSLDPVCVEACISSRTSAILGVHLWGRACDIDSLQTLADRHRLKLIFDAAHAFGSSYRQRRLGNFGYAEMLSFHATKFIHSLEGGAVVTDSAELARELRRLRNFGYENGVVQQAGLNAKMNEVSAVVGLRNLQTVDALIAANHQRYQHYCRELTPIPGLSLYQLPADEQQNYQYVVLEVLPEFGLSRNQIQQLLTAEGLLARCYFDPPCHLQPPFAGTSPRLPVTEALAQRILVLPTGSQLTLAQIPLIGQLLSFCQKQAESVQARISQKMPENI